MKEQRITIEISQDGKITADAEGFSGTACLKDLERLLDELAPGTASVDRRADDGVVLRTTPHTQNLGRKR